MYQPEDEESKGKAAKGTRKTTLTTIKSMMDIPIYDELAKAPFLTWNNIDLCDRFDLSCIEFDFHTHLIQIGVYCFCIGAILL